MGDLKVIRQALFRSSNSTFVGKCSQKPATVHTLHLILIRLCRMYLGILVVGRRGAPSFDFPL